jgi:hypothetical protein
MLNAKIMTTIIMKGNKIYINWPAELWEEEDYCTYCLEKSQCSTMSLLMAAGHAVGGGRTSNREEKCGNEFC